MLYDKRVDDHAGDQLGFTKFKLKWSSSIWKCNLIPDKKKEDECRTRAHVVHVLKKAPAKS